jgi:hypothetical protein
MHNLASLAERERDPDKFVMLAAEMAALPWVSGIDWQTRRHRWLATSHVIPRKSNRWLAALRSTRVGLQSTLVLHIRLLARLLTDYHEASSANRSSARTPYAWHLRNWPR